MRGRRGKPLGIHKGKCETDHPNSFKLLELFTSMLKEEFEAIKTQLQGLFYSLHRLYHFMFSPHMS
jgi:hypothetical protein